MNFQEFCEQAKEIDHQSISTDNSFVINFSKPGGSAFSVNPADIILFLKFLSAEHQACRNAIESEDRFSKEKAYTNYQEKPYRALYKLLAEKEGLKTISTLGGSQTKELTKVVSKLISFIAGVPYSKIEDNTYFDKPTIDIALAEIPTDLTFLNSAGSMMRQSFNQKENFKQWLRGRNLSESSVTRYAETSISEASKILIANNVVKYNLYNLKQKKMVIDSIAWLADSTEWRDKNSTGNSMYQSGVNRYLEFIEASLKCVNLPKPFILLAGISGTGKTRFVKEQALAHGVGDKNYCLAPVRPDWHEPSDLLGYVSRINGTPKYITTKVLQFIINAWRAIAPSADEHGTGEMDFSTPPYWLCLDEMNLAPVEQYFADYLAVLESRKFENGEYSCQPLLGKDILTLADADVRGDLGLLEENGLWAYFVNHGISLPPNLIVAGTVNMDETTHGFSRKVIDRALTIDFGKFFPNDYQQFFGDQDKPKLFSYSRIVQATEDDLSSGFDSDGKKSIAFISAVNEILENTPFELAYRALNELLLYIVCFKPKDEATLQAIWDDFLMCKILPRIDGDEDKLRVTLDGQPENLLDALLKTLETQLKDIWATPRIDMFREAHDGEAITDIKCRSRQKLTWMKNRLEANTFTSFWP